MKGSGLKNKLGKNGKTKEKKVKKEEKSQLLVQKLKYQMVKIRDKVIF